MAASDPRGEKKVPNYGGTPRPVTKRPNLERVVRRAIINQIFLSILSLLGGLLLGLLALVYLASDGLVSFRGGLFGIGGLCVLAYGVWNLRRSLRWNANADEYPAYQSPSLGTPQYVREALRAELESLSTFAVRNVWITPGWVITITRWNVQASHFTRLAWFHKKVTSTKYYGVITVSKSYSLELYTLDGQTSSFTGANEAQVDELLGILAERAPWAIAGFSAEIQKVWASNRPEFIRAVEQRKAQILNPPAPEAPVPEAPAAEPDPV